MVENNIIAFIIVMSAFVLFCISVCYDRFTCFNCNLDD